MLTDVTSVPRSLTCTSGSRDLAARTETVILARINVEGAYSACTESATVMMLQSRVQACKCGPMYTQELVTWAFTE